MRALWKPAAVLVLLWLSYFGGIYLLRPGPAAADLLLAIGGLLGSASGLLVIYVFLYAVDWLFKWEIKPVQITKRISI